MVEDTVTSESFSAWHFDSSSGKPPAPILVYDHRMGTLGSIAPQSVDMLWLTGDVLAWQSFPPDSVNTTYHIVQLAAP
jgi:hypothetical protein